jgi:hypothetical protein
LTWLTHVDFLPKVEEIWLAPTRDTRALDRVLFKLKKVKKGFEGLGFQFDWIQEEKETNYSINPHGFGGG